MTQSDETYHSEIAVGIWMAGLTAIRTMAEEGFVPVGIALLYTDRLIEAASDILDDLPDPVYVEVNEALIEAMKADTPEGRKKRESK